MEKEKATHSSILAWRAPWTVQSMGCKESCTTEQFLLHFNLNNSWTQGYKNTKKKKELEPQKINCVHIAKISLTQANIQKSKTVTKTEWHVKGEFSGREIIAIMVTHTLKQINKQTKTPTAITMNMNEEVAFLE